MTTPNLIVQPRELARSIRELRRQKEQMDAITAARDREIAAEQARPDANRSQDARLAEFLNREQVAHAVFKYMGAQASSGVDVAPPLMPIPDPMEALAECKSELERILAVLPSRTVILRLVDVPSGVDQTKVKGILRPKNEAPVEAGYKFNCSLRWACEHIPELEALGVKVEYLV